MKFYDKLFIFAFLLSSLFTSELNSQTNQNKETLLILNNPSDSGMFAIFRSVLGGINYYEQGNYAGFKVDLNSGRYLDPAIGPNWWEYFFEPLSLGTQGSKVHHFTFDEYMELHTCPFPEFRAYQFIQAYIHLKQHIQKKLDTFVNRNFRGHFVIGVHHRGTDKILEWPPVPYKKTYEAIKEVIKGLSETDKKDFVIYIATDDKNFLTFIKKRFPKKIIYNEFARSINSTPLHEYGPNFYSNNYQMGEEALLDCLCLANCNVLIRPWFSCLSWASTTFNPYIRDIVLMGE